MTASWRVGAILNEPLAATLRFAAWYLDQGAAGLTLLFDNPRDPAIGVLSAHPGIVCVRCDAAFWEGLGLSPAARFTRRQNAGLTWVYRQTREDWLLNLDADEFLYVNHGTIGTLLAAQPADLPAVRVMTAEAVLPEVKARDTLFRLPMERDIARRIYQEDTALFGPKRMGLVGHAGGKSAIRSGQPGVRLRQHWAHGGDGEKLAERVLGPQSGAHLLHLNAPDFDSWRDKLDWRLSARGFTGPLAKRLHEARGGAEPEAALRAIFTSLYGVSEARFARMCEAGVGMALDLDLDARVARQIPNA
ncbi:glycosyltransferase family 2 protein [Poseidonocella sedimentorum]|uniref:Glycosyl transferase family 2 n=1 Tax=Poseidonocella sedimentorum TaxID=871652 RepID=A0A1I6ERP2_9RHOB|nr:glycosyltransferase family 2 protein [Poseidonocella sedimentorum]SFR20365.1 Glycosyl transferase family 2 [Poseidonocella sedimentorum]